MDAGLIRPTAGVVRKGPVRRDAVRTSVETELAPEQTVTTASNSDAANNRNAAPTDTSVALPGLIDGAIDPASKPIEQDLREQALLRQKAYSRVPAAKIPARQTDLET